MTGLNMPQLFGIFGFLQFRLLVGAEKCMFLNYGIGRHRQLNTVEPVCVRLKQSCDYELDVFASIVQKISKLLGLFSQGTEIKTIENVLLRNGYVFTAAVSDDPRRHSQ